MKKLLFFAVLVIIAQAGFSQQALPNNDLAVAAFETTNFDFGKIKRGVPATHEFRFVNKGKVPMIITNVQASCGCTTPAWTKEPIPPGGQGFITATFNAASVGLFSKSVTMTANIENGQTVLIIRGEVVEIVQ